MTRIAISALLIILIYTVAVTNGEGWKILGGYFQTYDTASRYFRGTTREWGNQDNGAGTSVLTLVNCYCRDNFWRQRGYCYQKLIVSNNDNQEEPHYQVEGSYQVIYDRYRRVMLDTIYNYGRRCAEPPMQDIVVAEGETWNPIEGAWAYGYLHFIVNYTTGPSSTNAFSRQQHHSTNLQETKEEVYIGQPSHSSSRTNLANFRSWVSGWGEYTVQYFYRWT